MINVSFSRILSKLISANTRRATNLHVQIHATQLAWGITTDQISLLIRLFKNHYQENLVIGQKVTVLKPPSSTDLSCEYAITYYVHNIIVAIPKKR